MIRNKKEKNMIEITTDTEGIYMRDYQDTLVTREIPNHYGYYNDAGEYVENGTHTITHRYRGGSKPQYGYVRSQYNTLAEYADTFAIYPK
jgi:hypothetical protein